MSINWEGGRHHARSNRASGFCYVNDVVLAINELLKGFQKVLYCDLDVHHGDGVEQAFITSNSVLTISFHMYGPGLFPGTGSLETIGKGRGKFHNINVPFKEGIDSDGFYFVFHEVITLAMMNFMPDVIVACWFVLLLQNTFFLFLWEFYKLTLIIWQSILISGADSLSGDPLGKFNLTTRGYGKCVQYLLGLAKQLSIPSLLLGGGGYSNENTARLFAHLTGIAVCCHMPNLFLVEQEIPDNCKYFDHYTCFDFHTKASAMKNENTMEELQELVKKSCNLLMNLKT